MPRSRTPGLAALPRTDRLLPPPRSYVVVSLHLQLRGLALHPAGPPPHPCSTSGHRAGPCWGQRTQQERCITSTAPASERTAQTPGTSTEPAAPPADRQRPAPRRHWPRPPGSPNADWLACGSLRRDAAAAAAAAKRARPEGSKRPGAPHTHLRRQRRRRRQGGAGGATGGSRARAASAASPPARPLPRRRRRRRRLQAR